MLPQSEAGMSIETEIQARLSGPGLRVFQRIANMWELSEAQCVAALGHPDPATYQSWISEAAEHAAVDVTFDTLSRISAIVGIYKALSTLFSDNAHALQWLTSPHQGTEFAGATPLSFIVEGGPNGMMTVRYYLDWCCGDVAQGEVNFKPAVE
jgi:hypothetical protein